MWCANEKWHASFQFVTKMFHHRKIPGSAECNENIWPENKEIFKHIYLLEVISLIFIILSVLGKFSDKGKFPFSRSSPSAKTVHLVCLPSIHAHTYITCILLYYMPEITCLQDCVYIPMHMSASGQAYVHVYLCVLTFMKYIRLNYDCVMHKMCFCAQSQLV